MQQIGLTTGLRYSWHVLDVLKGFSKAGVKNVELWGHPDHANLLDSRLVAQLRELKSEFNFVSFHPPARGEWAIDSLVQSRRQKTFDKLRRVIDQALQLGVNSMVLHPGSKRPQKDFTTRRVLASVADFLDRLLDFLSTRPLQLCLENTLPHHLGGRFSELKWLDNHTESDFMVTLDTSHAFLGETPINKYIKYFGSRIRHIHLSDNHGKRDDHLPPGEGKINFPAVLRDLYQYGYVEYWLLEVLKVPGSKGLYSDCREIFSRFEKLLSKSFSRPLEVKK